MLRPITSNDIGLIIDMLLTLSAESPRYKRVLPDVPYVSGRLASMIEHPDFIGSIDVDLRGVMFGQACNQWYERERNAYELLLYILPEFRGGFLAPRLIKNFEQIARTRGCVHVHAGVSTLMNTEETLGLYERLGYIREGTGVFKKVQDIV